MDPRWPIAPRGRAAGVAVGDDPMEPLVVALMSWIAAASGLPMAEDLPETRRISAQRMAALAAPARDQDGYDRAVASGYLALYHADSATVLLRRDWDRDDLRDRSILLHELVHHMQAASGRSYPCAGAREHEAYTLQGEWLEERGADLFELLGINGLFLYAVTRC